VKIDRDTDQVLKAYCSKEQLDYDVLLENVVENFVVRELSARVMDYLSRRNFEKPIPDWITSDWLKGLALDMASRKQIDPHFLTLEPRPRR
jgi:hypothetical protein